ncbi:MAG TPA: prepilin-type N-terminal cleavage/methylation domain-containing protein [Candidatus Paceibacterota bacterium]|nr:prepilin-type N-terminal cleavage/methylation domain-containing protein [Candidatus Paceibacterota bacterium]
MSKVFHKNKYNKGVTLIELLVVLSIFVIISGITVFSYGKFNSSLSIQNLADDIALAVRRAQGYAIGVRGTSGMFTDGYGVHFTANPSASIYSGSNKSFILFADISGNNRYDNSSNVCGSPSASNECLELLSITSLDKITEIYVNDSTLISSTSTVDLIFKRPNPEPYFCYRVNGTGSCSASTIYNMKIKISPDANPSTFKIINISNNGQISVSS